MAMQIGPIEIPEVAVLAPMAGFTDLSFRLLCKEQGCGLVYTELVSADCLLRGVHRSIRLVETDPKEHPVGVQLYGSDVDKLAEAARWVEENVPCDLIDLNMGCPVARIVSRGEGAALMRDPKLVERLVRAVSNAVSLPVTAKIRAGWTDAEINAVEVSQAIEAGGSSAVAVHARTRSQKHEGKVDFSLLAAIKNAVSIPVLGNGGIRTAQDALSMRAETGVDAVMVARGALGNPWIFSHIERVWRGLEPIYPTDNERLAMLERHLRGSVRSSHQWARKERQRQSAEGRGVAAMRGHLLQYVEASPGARRFRQGLNDLHTVDDAIIAAHAAFLNDGCDGLHLPAPANHASEFDCHDPSLPAARRSLPAPSQPCGNGVHPCGLPG
jgi:tRNA-dihydrouridine synthase B